LHPGLIDTENRDPVPLLRGIRRALDKGWLDENDLLITFLGTGVYGDSERFKEDVASLSLEPFVQVTVDRVPYRQALARMAGADVLIVLSENLSDVGAQVQAWTAMQVPAKLYEYLRLGRPLLALVSEGAVKELLETTRTGAATPPRDTEGVALALKRLYAERLPIRSSLPPANSSISSYSRESLSAALAEQLHALTAGDRASEGEAATCA
jgi:glycosyltransferase involved in cell wall biosynthesis